MVLLLTFCWFHPQLLQQLKRLICDLCRLYNLPQHPDVEMLDQPLPAGPITQERKVSMDKRIQFIGLVVVLFMSYIVITSLQHGPSDEVTSEEEEEEEMGEVPLCIFYCFMEEYCFLIIQFVYIPFLNILCVIHCGSRTLTWTKT